MDAETLIARNETRDELTTNMMKDKNTMQTDVEKQDQKTENRGDKEEKVFNETVKEEVLGIRGIDAPTTTGDWTFKIGKQSKIGWSARSRVNSRTCCVEARETKRQTRVHERRRRHSQFTAWLRVQSEAQ